MTPTRPALRYFGSKWLLAPWIMGHFPHHRVYVEPFGGGGNVLLRKPVAYAEIYNDLDEELVGLFRVLRDEVNAARLIELLRLTPFARMEFNASYEATDDQVERARRLIVRAFMGHGADGTCTKWRTGFRANSNKSGTTPAHDWANYPDALAFCVERLRRVIIEHRDARRVMATHDSDATLHYIDPPYLHSTRSRKSRRRGKGGVAAYRHEMTDADHGALLAFLPTLKGMAVLSGYPHPMYDDALPGWQRVERQAHADGARDRVEVLWINPACAARLRDKGPLFEAVA